MRSYPYEDTDKRLDARKYFGDTPVPVDCKTIDDIFRAQVRNVSASGVFIETKKSLKTGKEIAFTFKFPRSEQIVMATGEVTRTDISGVGVRITIFFKHDRNGKY